MRDYSHKIKYWSAEMFLAIEALDTQKIQYVAKKLDYFVGRQKNIVDKYESIYS